MKRTLLTALSLLVASTITYAAPKPGATPAAPAAPGTTAPAAADGAAVASKPLPFVGKITKFDVAGKTFSINGKGGDRVYLVDDATKIAKDGKPATLADLTVGEEVGGSYVKTGETLTAKSLRIGAKAKPVAATPKPGAAPAAPGTPAAKPVAATPAAKKP